MSAKAVATLVMSIEVTTMRVRGSGKDYTQWDGTVISQDIWWKYYFSAGSEVLESTHAAISSRLIFLWDINHTCLTRCQQACDTPNVSTSAVLTTFRGSTIAALIMSTYLPFWASYPHANLSGQGVPMMMEDSSAALCMIARAEWVSARWMMVTLRSWSKFTVGTSLLAEPSELIVSMREAFNKATPTTREGWLPWQRRV